MARIAAPAMGERGGRVRAVPGEPVCSMLDGFGRRPLNCCMPSSWATAGIFSVGADRGSVQWDRRWSGARRHPL